MQHPLGGHALGQGAVHHAAGNGGHAVEPAHQPALGPLHPAAQRVALDQAQIERGVHLVVLNVQPASGAPQGGKRHRRGRAHQGRLHHPHHVGFPAPLGPQHRQAAQGEAGQVQQALEAAGLVRHPQRRAHHTHALPGLAAVLAGAVAGPHLPGRVVGWRGDDAHLVPCMGQPLRHLAGVLADAGEFGGEIDAVEKQLHRVPFGRGAAMGLAVLALARAAAPTKARTPMNFIW